MTRVLMAVAERLLDAGLVVRPPAPARSGRRDHADEVLEVDAGGVSAIFGVVGRKRFPYGVELDGLDVLRAQIAEDTTPLLAVPFVSEAGGERLRAAGWSWIDEAGNFDLRAEGLVVRQRRSDHPPRKPDGPLPQGSGALGVIRWLLAATAEELATANATGLAQRVGVSQPRVSQVLGKLRDFDLVGYERGKIDRVDRERLLDRFRSAYRGPGGSASWFHSPDDARSTAVFVTHTALETGRRAVVSGDVAADLLSPWRGPTTPVIYIERGLTADQLGVTPATGPGDGDLFVCVPEDDSVFSSTTTRIVESELLENEGIGPIPVPVAGVEQVLWDLDRLGGDDRAEAAARLAAWFVEVAAES